MTNDSPLPHPEVLLHEKKVLVVNKPGGLLTQGPPGIDSLELRIKRWRGSQLGPDSKNYLGVAHRLDRPASGAMVFATDKPTTKHLCRQFENREIRKTYWALVEGRFEDESGTWTDFMRKIPDEAKSEIVPAAHPDAQNAILDFRVLQQGTLEIEGGKIPFTHLQINLQTGRTHQIRLQCASRGHSILGDELYRSTVPFGPQEADLRLRWIALHARSLEFQHPNTGKNVEAIAEIPVCWQQVL